MAKPDPAAFTAACRYLRVDPCRVLNVGDWMEGDVAAAAQAGVSAVWLDRGLDPATGEPTATATAYGQAPVRIERLTDLIECLGPPA